jgi:hypothetical protein
MWRGEIRFHSRLEARHYDELQAMRAAGLMRYFLRQVPFALPGGRVHRVDWMVVLPEREPQYFDSKGIDTQMGRLKRDQVRDLYGVEIRLWTKHVEI